MSSLQERFLPHGKPLNDRLGAAFFRAIPSVPGVYYLRDAEKTVLYVGQSKNLHQRLATYKNANPKHTSRRILRLIAAAHHIDWETHPTQEAAILRENHLLRTLKPRFNRANIYPEGYKYLTLEVTNQQAIVTESAQRPEAGYGAFKGMHRGALAVLARFCFRLSHQARHWWELPLGSALPKRRQAVSISLQTTRQNGIQEQTLRDFLSGRSNQLVEDYLQIFASRSDLSRFDETWILADLELLQTFYQNGPCRNRRLLERFQIEGTLIDANSLNDLIVRDSLRRGLEEKMVRDTGFEPVNPTVSR